MRALDGTTKERVMQAALHIFAERGYAGASLRDIAAMAGVTKPMVYYHFGSKAGLYQALLDQSLDESFAQMKLGDQGATLRERLVRVVESMLTYGMDNPDMIRIVVQTFGMAPGEIPPEIRYQEKLRARFVWLRSLMQDGIARGELACRDADLLTISLLGQTHFLITSKVILGGPHPADKITPAAIIALFMGGAEPRERAGPAPGMRAVPA